MTRFGKDWFASNIKPAFERVVSGGRIYLIFVTLFGLLLLIGIGAGINALVYCRYSSYLRNVS